MAEALVIRSEWPSSNIGFTIPKTLKMVYRAALPAPQHNRVGVDRWCWFERAMRSIAASCHEDQIEPPPAKLILCT